MIVSLVNFLMPQLQWLAVIVQLARSLPLQQPRHALIAHRAKHPRYRVLQCVLIVSLVNFLMPQLQWLAVIVLLAQFPLLRHHQHVTLVQLACSLFQGIRRAPVAVVAHSPAVKARQFVQVAQRVNMDQAPMFQGLQRPIPASCVHRENSVQLLELLLA
jgi:hypothetical protein